MNRREFLEATLALMVSTEALAAGKSPASQEVSRRKLGRTGELVSCIGLGGAHIGGQKDEATWQERRDTGAWWKRTRVGEYLPPTAR